MPMSSGAAILGLSFDYHDAAAAVVVDGRVVAAAEEERFTRLKHDPSLPRHAIAWCLEEAGVGPGDLAGVAFHDKPFTTYERILVTHARVGPRGFPALARAVAQWSRSKLWVGYRIERALRDLGVDRVPVHFAEHHLSHAGAAFYPSPFEEAAILTFDGVGEWATSSIGFGSGSRIELRRELRFPDSLGLMYSAFTAFCGFEVNDGEYKLMGLAPYGTPRYADVLRDRVVRIADDGAVHLDQRWFAYRAGAAMTAPRLAELLDGPASDPGAAPGQREADVAASVQLLLEEAVLRSARHAHDLTGARSACLAGGVALNCVANRRLLEDGPFDDIWVQPAAGDSGSAVGAALWSWHQVLDHPRSPAGPDGMSGAFLGPAYGHDEVAAWLTGNDVPFTAHDDDTVAKIVADDIDGGAVVGWFRGRLEFGPRALGHRSILADPRDPAVVGRVNALVKGREGFRPFAPAVLAEHAADWFDIDAPSPYMLRTVAVRGAVAPPAGGSFAERLALVDSPIPACTHVDGSARVQTVDEATNPELYALLSAFHAATGCPVLLNTSFNRAGEPIVRTPADALRCAAAAGLDLLVLERCVVRVADIAGGVPC